MLRPYGTDRKTLTSRLPQDIFPGTLRILLYYYDYYYYYYYYIVLL